MTDAAPGRKMGLYRYLATSGHTLPRLVRGVFRASRSWTLPAPRLVVKPMLWAFLAGRFVCHTLKRTLICEPLFKAACERYGKRLRTGAHVHWIQGRGAIRVGDRVWVDGKSTFTFAHQFCDRPALEIGDDSGIGHGCTFVVGRRVVVGKRCLISGEDLIFDSSGHATDVKARRAGRPPPEEDVREVVIGDDVWIGTRVIIFPGVTIGRGSIVSAGSVVHTHIPPYSVAAGNPARVMFRIPRPAGADAEPRRPRDGHGG